ncbi:MAG: hydrogenase maturation protease [Cyanobacteria bacterium SID2]|nr:hydrogenase maturation protease [Cyanobacteria bacterium SID2]
MLVIGYGNSLRGDDGIGRVVADRVADWNLSHVRSISVHQLMPELAEELSKVDRAVFVDARIDGDAVLVESLEPDDGNSLLGHSLTPRSLLGLSKWLYHQVPEAWLISVPGECFDFCDRLSPTAERRVVEVLDRLQVLFDLN